MSVLIGLVLTYLAVMVFVLLPIGLVLKAVTPDDWWGIEEDDEDDY